MEQGFEFVALNEFLSTQTCRRVLVVAIDSAVGSHACSKVCSVAAGRDPPDGLRCCAGGGVGRSAGACREECGQCQGSQEQGTRTSSRSLWKSSSGHWRGRVRGGGGGVSGTGGGGSPVTLAPCCTRR